MADRVSHGYDLAGKLFEMRGEDLCIGGLAVREVVSEVGSPAYLYDGGAMRRAYRRLAAALGGFASIYYSAKANPARHLPLALRQTESSSPGPASVARSWRR